MEICYKSSYRSSALFSPDTEMKCNTWKFLRLYKPHEYLTRKPLRWSMIGCGKTWRVLLQYRAATIQWKRSNPSYVPLCIGFKVKGKKVAHYHPRKCAGTQKATSLILISMTCILFLLITCSDSERWLSEGYRWLPWCRKRGYVGKVPA